MSNERRRRQRLERQRQRRSNRSRGAAGYESLGPVEFTGVMGWMQRNMRLFFLVGIAVMVLSLGSIFFATQLGSADSVDEDDIAADEDAADDEASEHDAVTPTAEAEGESDGDEGDEEIVRSYAAPPPVTIDPSKDYEAVIETERGTVRVELLAEEAPTYVNNFVFLARNDFYDGLTFHRVLPGFVAQAGDPTGGGSGGPGYLLPPETNDLTFSEGALSMAKSPLGVSGSQFFITLGPTPHLNDGFTVFGRVTEGMDVLRSLTERDPQAEPDFEGDEIVDIEIVESGGEGGGETSAEASPEATATAEAGG